MFRCFARPGGSIHVPPSWLPSFASSGSRGIKLSSGGQITKATFNFTPIALSKSGRDWRDELAKNDIGSYHEFKTVQAMGGFITLKSATRHVSKFSDDVYLSEVGHPFAEAVVRRYLRDHKEKPLWCVTTIYSSDFAIVRGKTKYRAHAAFYQALKNAGYDKSGRRIAERKEGGRTATASELFGTVNIMTSAPKELLKKPFTTLRDFFEQAIKKLERQLGKSSASPDAESGSERPRVLSQRPQHQAHSGLRKRTDGSSSENRRPNVPWRGTPAGSGGDGGSHRKSGQLPRKQSRVRDKTPVNTGF